MLDLYYWPTPNGKKVTILLEEAGIDYNIVPLNISFGDQFKEDFLKINPNHRMPTLVDTEPKDGKEPNSVFESGAIMMYIAEKENKFWPADMRERYNVIQWIMWQMANQGPKLGECGHYRRLSEKQGDQSYAIRRYTDEANRLYGVLNYRLHQSRYLAGDNYSLADMICYPWCAGHEHQGQDLNEFKYMKRWYDELSERPGVQRGMAVGKDDMVVDPSTLTDEDKKRIREMLYNQRAIKVPD